MINTDRAFICLGIADRELTIRNARAAIAVGHVAADKMAVCLEYVAGLEALNAKARRDYGIGKVKAVGA